MQGELDSSASESSQQRRGPYRKVLSVDKERLVKAFEHGDDYVELARQLGIKRQTARSIVMRSLRSDERRHHTEVFVTEKLTKR